MRRDKEKEEEGKMEWETVRQEGRDERKFKREWWTRGIKENGGQEGPKRKVSKINSLRQYIIRTVTRLCYS